MLTSSEYRKPAAGWVGMGNVWIRVTALAVVVSLGLAGCGGETSTEAGVDSAGAADAPESSDVGESSDAEAVAEANQPLLEPGETVLEHQVLDVADGSIATLGEAIDGDRPVLLWFFSPH